VLIIPSVNSACPCNIAAGAVGNSSVRWHEVRKSGPNQIARNLSLSLLCEDQPQRWLTIPVVATHANRISSKKTVPAAHALYLTAVKLLMYAFGDDPNPAPESVSVLEDIMTEYINEMVQPFHPVAGSHFHTCFAHCLSKKAWERRSVTRSATDGG